MSLVSNNKLLPAVTTDGTNTFGCLVNKTLFVPDPIPGHKSGVYAELQFYKNVVGVNIYADNFATQQSLLIFLYNPAGLETGQVYDLSDPDFFVQYIDFRKPPNCTYRSVVAGNIKIEKCDITSMTSKIISATFDFRAASEECSDVVEVTEGRFDIGDFRE